MTLWDTDREANQTFALSPPPWILKKLKLVENKKCRIPIPEINDIFNKSDILKRLQHKL